MKSRIVLSCLLTLSAALAACGPRECVLGDSSGCERAQVCEAVAGETKGRCYAPVQVQGSVRDLYSGSAIADAVVVAVTPAGEPVGPRVTTSSDGSFRLQVPSSRDKNGVPAARTVELRAYAQDYGAFPGPVRGPSRVTTPGENNGTPDKGYLVASASTELGLVPLPSAARGRPSISGTVEPSPQGLAVLVVAERGGTGTGFSALADSAGAFKLFNVEPATYTVRGYSQGVNYTPVTTAVQATSATVALARANVTPGAVQGSVSLLAATSSTAAAAGPTTVRLVPESTYLATVERGDVPPGLVTPGEGQAPGVNGTWKIDGVPDGRYIALAANTAEGNVARANPPVIVVSNGLPDTQPAIEVIGAANLLSPGASAIDDAPARPLFTWQPYPTADGYVISVYDVQGREVQSQAVISGSAAAVQANADLPPGLYQWRVRTYQTFVPRSRSEPGKGTFRVR